LTINPRKRRHPAICLAVLAAMCFGTVRAQSPRSFPLSAGTCTTLHPGDVFTLDWNPEFDYENEVAGLNRFILALSPLDRDNTTPIRHPGAANPNQVGFRATSIHPLANGYYHFEFQVSPRFGTGLFRVTGALAVPHPVEGASGPAPRMTFSPEREYFCINVVPTPSDTPTSTGH